jgi:2-polyprenyl-3-methyl-5-hydroxy-6-metoxy-1,4-benzoquinol methylase
VSLPTVAVTRCACCGASGSRPRPLGPHPLVACTTCGTVRSARVDDPAAVYADGYHDGSDGFFVDTDAPGLHSYLERAYRLRLDLLESVVAPPGRLLDVGCGRGDFLVAARTSGWDVTGVELVPSAAAAARDRHGLDVRAGALQDAGLQGGFDVVCAMHVVEHVLDVPDLLEQLTALTRPGGRVVLEVPNFDALLRRRKGGAWQHLRPREHVTHFTAATLTAVLSRSGLRPVAMWSPSYTGAAIEVGQMVADVGLVELAGPLTRLDRTGASPLVRRGLRVVERGLSRSRLGVVLLVVAERT